MTRVEELQEIECFTAAYLTEHDPVWAIAEGCFQKVTDAHSRQSVLWLPGFKTNKIVVVYLDFALTTSFIVHPGSFGQFTLILFA